jgi:hypothetical protein
VLYKTIVLYFALGKYNILLSSFIVIFQVDFVFDIELDDIVTMQNQLLKLGANTKLLEHIFCNLYYSLIIYIHILNNVKCARIFVVFVILISASLNYKTLDIQVIILIEVYIITAPFNSIPILLADLVLSRISLLYKSQANQR